MLRLRIFSVLHPHTSRILSNFKRFLFLQGLCFADEIFFTQRVLHVATVQSVSAQTNDINIFKITNPVQFLKNQNAPILMGFVYY